MIYDARRNAHGLQSVDPQETGRDSDPRARRSAEPFDESQIAEKFRRVSAVLLGERAADDLLRLSLAALDEDGGPKNLLLEIERACAVAAGAGRTSL